MARTFRTAPPRKLDVVRPHSMVALGLVTMYLMQLLLMKLTGALQPSLADRRFPAAGNAAGVAAAAGAYRRGLAQEPPQPRQQAHAGPAAGATLSRAQQAMRLERLANSDPMLGICHEGSPMLPGVPERVCKDLHCLWSERAQSNVDLWLNALRVLPSDALESRCPEPQGGQRPVSAGTSPKVSFIITMHNSPLVTAQALLELFRTAHEVESAEFVLVNDGSTEDVTVVEQVVHQLRELFGARVTYLVNSQARGFGEANTQGIQAAAGEFVVLVNNDMFVVRGWLATIMQTFQQRPDAGMIGPLFLGARDLVTEAGGLVYNDASAANYGRGMKPDHTLGYLREVDYISAACVVMRRALFWKLGGFDARYVKGYYEDTDLAMAVRSAGLRVLLQPLAVVYHQEGGTFGTDETSELKRRLMAENRDKFERKWRGDLRSKHCPANTPYPIAAARYGWPRVLWVDDIVPEPDKDSGSIRTINMLRILLQEGYHVTYIGTYAGPGHHPRYPAQARFLGVDVLPIGVEFEGCPFDVVLVARRDIYGPMQGKIASQCPGKPIIYDTVDLHFLREARTAMGEQMSAPEATSKAQDPLPWHMDVLGVEAVQKWLRSGAPDASKVIASREIELALMRRSNLTVVVSPDEVDMIHAYLPDAKVAVVSNIHEVPRSPPNTTCHGRSGILFVGNMNHLPNRQAAEVLVREIVPRVRALLPEPARQYFRLHIVGSNMVPENLLQLFAQHEDVVTFHGYLTDDQLRMLYSSVKVVVAPLLSGAGVKGKVNQAMKYGVPVVATPLAVEGMFAQDGEECLIAWSAEEFAQKVVRAYTDCQLWSRLVRGGHANMLGHFSMESARPAVLEAFKAVGVGPAPAGRRGSCHLQPAVAS